MNSERILKGALDRLLQISLIAVCGVSGASVAQTIESDDGGERVLANVLVTAQRRDENIIDVPISMSLLSPEITTAFGVSEVNELALVTPSLTLNGSSGVAGEGFKIRGVGGSTLADGIEQSVSVLVDEVVTGSSGSGLLEFWDVSRIEVLRGPQGTLFGKNASAGVISILNNGPGSNFDAGFSTEYSPTYDEFRVDYHIGGPVSDLLGLRFAGFYANRGEGHIENPVRNTTENKGERWGARLKGQWESGAISVDGSIEISKQDKDCCSRTFSYIDTNTTGSALSQIFLARIAANGIEPRIGLETNISDAEIRHTNDVVHAVLKPTYSLESGADIRSITGYRTWKQVAITDSDMMDVDLANRFDIRRDMRVFSQEFQYLSPDDGPLKYLVGLYHFRQWFDVDADLGTGTFLSGGVPLQTLQETRVESENSAIYGHASYEFTERWTGFVGARLLRDSIEADFVSNGNFFFFPTGLRAGQASAADTNWTGTLGIQYHWPGNSVLYASVSRGYKGPAIDVSISGGIANPNSDATLEPEIVESYEIGSKGSYFDNRLRLDAVAYYSDVTDFQATGLDTQTATFVLQNAGKVRSKGVEVDVTLVPTDSLNLYFNVAYTDAKFKQFEGAPCTVPQSVAGACSNAAGGQDLSGRRVNQTPEWAVSLGARYDNNIAGVPAYLRGDASWQDDMISNLNLDPNTRIPAYWVANFEVGLTPIESTKIAFWVRNAFDEKYTNRILDVSAFNGGYASFPAIGRRVGVTLTYTY